MSTVVRGRSGGRNTRVQGSFSDPATLLVGGLVTHLERNLPEYDSSANRARRLCMSVILLAVLAADGGGRGNEQVSTADEAVFRAIIDSKFVDSWARLHSDGEIGFTDWFVDPAVRMRLKGTPGVDTIKSTTRRAFESFYRPADFAGVPRSDVLLLLFCRTVVLTWHIVATRSHLLVRSSGAGDSYSIAWRHIKQFESSTTAPKHYTVHGKRDSVVSGSGKRFSVLGPFEARMLLPDDIVALLERLRAYLTELDREELEPGQRLADSESGRYGDAGVSERMTASGTQSSASPNDVVKDEL